MAPQRTMRDVIRPRTLRRLGELGMLDPRRLVAGAGVLPWLAGRGPSLGLLSQLHATSRPTRTAIVDREGALTWWELEQRANRLARGLAELGVHPGDEVALLLRNGRQFVEGMLATQKTGVVPSLMNTWAKASELATILERAAPPALVYDTRSAEQLDGAVPSRTRLVHVGPDAAALPGSVGYESLLEGQRRTPLAPLVAERGRNALHIHTSGTTGTPKAAERSTATKGFASLLGLIDTVPYRHDDVLYVPNPLFHALGIGVLAVGLGAGTTMVLPDAFDPRQAFEDLAEHRVTAMSVVPVMLQRMLDLEGPHLDPSLRLILVSGSALGANLRERARARFGDVLYDLYGSTEAGWIAIATPETMRTAPESVGKPALGVEVALLDEQGNRVDEGEGEIAVRSSLTFEGYASGEETDERAGFLAMGDLGRFDDQGHLYVLGRTDDMVVVGGENVYPVEVEAVIDDVEGVEDVAVFGVADEELSEVLAAFVVGDVDADAVRSACEEHLASYKVPRRIEVVDELPRTATGKVLRRELATGDR